MELQLQASVLPMNIQGCFPLRLTGLISSQSEGLSRVFFSTTISRNSQEFSPAPQSKSINFLVLILMAQISHPYMTTGETISLTLWTFVGKVIALLFNMLSRLVITFLPRSKRLLISCQHLLITCNYFHIVGSFLVAQ